MEEAKEQKKTYYTDAGRRATNRYVAANYDKIIFKVRKGRRDRIHKLAESLGTSTQALIISLLEKEAERVHFDLSVPEQKEESDGEKSD